MSAMFSNNKTCGPQAGLVILRDVVAKGEKVCRSSERLFAGSTRSEGRDSSGNIRIICRVAQDIAE